MQPARLFCTLKYRSRLKETGETREADLVLVLVLMSERKGLRISVSPMLQQAVDESDRQYVKELLQDCRIRAANDPEALFSQLSSLSVGPLTTDRVGATDSARDYLECCSGFDAV